LSAWTGGDFQEYVPRAMTEQIQQWENRIRQIEESYFPDIPSGGPTI